MDQLPVIGESGSCAGGGDADRLRVILIGEVGAAEEVERGAIVLDGVVAKTEATHGAQIQVLQGVAGKVRAHKRKHPRIQIAVVADSASLGVGGGAGGRQLVRAIDGGRIEAGVVV